MRTRTWQAPSGGSNRRRLALYLGCVQRAAQAGDAGRLEFFATLAERIERREAARQMEGR